MQHDDGPTTVPASLCQLVPGICRLLWRPDPDNSPTTEPTLRLLECKGLLKPISPEFYTSGPHGRTSEKNSLADL